MLRHVEGRPAPALLDLLESQPELSVRIRSLWRAYGTEQTFFDIWAQDEGRACLARLDDAFFLVDGGADYEEIAWFLNLAPQFADLIAEETAARRVAERLPAPWRLDRRHLLRQETAGAHRLEGAAVDFRPDLRSVYGVISSHFTVPGGFVSWYTDMSHRVRHGCARAFLVRAGERPASVCLVSAQSGNAGLISSVVTLPEFRRRGFAGALLDIVCAELLGGGRRPVLECREPLLPFYQKRGFSLVCPVAEVHTDRAETDGRK